MISNPELRRNFWLELSPHRLIGMPAVLLVIFICIYSFTDHNFNRMAWTALTLFAALTILWGTKLSSDAVFDEFRGKTWDMQRMSALDPWTLAWGKLIGANIFVWYGGAICLGVFIFCAINSKPEFHLIASLFLALGLALFTHASSMLSGILAVRNNRNSRSAASGFIFIFIIFVFPGFRWQGLLSNGTVNWYDLEIDRIWFLAISFWLFAVWSVIGVYRALCAELQLRKTFIAWLGFAAFLTIYCTGLIVGNTPGFKPFAVFASTGFFVTLTMTYISAWQERRDAITLSRLMLHWKSSNYRRLLEEMPCWMATAPIALIFVLLLVALGHSLLQKTPITSASTLPLGVWLFAMRDIGLLHFFSMGRNPRRVTTTTLVYLGVIYWLLPQLLSLMGLKPLAALFWVWYEGYAIWQLIGAGMQLLIVLWFVRRRWLDRKREIDQPGYDPKATQN